MVELPAQVAEYHNSPLRMFDQHDDGTVAQMRYCMSVGNVVAGVICAGRWTPVWSLRGQAPVHAG